MKFNFIFFNSKRNLLNIAIYQTILQYFSQKFSINLSPFKDLENYKNIFFSDEAELLI